MGSIRLHARLLGQFVVIYLYYYVDVQYSYTVSVNRNDEARKIIQTERQYTDSACKKNLYLTFETEWFICCYSDVDTQRVLVTKEMSHMMITT